MIEINGTYYAKDCIKVVGKISFPIRNNTKDNYYFYVVIVIGSENHSESFFFDTKEQAEQSRKQLIEQLNK